MNGKTLPTETSLALSEEQIVIVYMFQYLITDYYIKTFLFIGPRIPRRTKSQTMRPIPSG